MRSNLDRLEDILDAINRIYEKLPETKEEFLGSDLLQIWVMYHIQVVGEAANGLTRDFRQKYPGIPWQDIIAMRHILVHQYFGIDMNEIWITAHEDLPYLEGEIDAIIDKYTNEPHNQV